MNFVTSFQNVMVFLLLLNDFVFMFSRMGSALTEDDYGSCTNARYDALTREQLFS